MGGHRLIPDYLLTRADLAGFRSRVSIPPVPASPTRETVIVVHGTFAGNASGDRPMWYAPGGSFCAALDTALAAAGSNARCWAHLARGEAHFHWDGANDWLSRVKA